MNKRKRLTWSVSLVIALAGCSANGPLAPERSMINPISVDTTDPVERLLLILRHGDYATMFAKSKADAVVTLGILGDPRGVDILLEFLRHESNEHLRLDMIKALGWLGDKRAVPDLLERLKTGTGTYERAAAAHALGDIGDATAIPAIEAALELNPTMKREGTEALEKLRKANATPTESKAH